MKTIRWAIIGAGGIADRRAIPAILKDDSLSLVALMERVPALAEELGKKYGVPYFSTIEEMLRTVECDAVYIGTPVACHYEQAMLALKHGKHVFIEKPLARNEKEARALVDAFKDAGKQIRIFCDQLRAGKPDYFYADRAVQVQAVVDAVYKDNE